LKMILAKISK